MNKDWVEDSLQPRINAFNNFLASFDIGIDCTVSASTHCSTALTSDIKDGLDIIWGYHIAIARGMLQLEGEADAEAAELACYQEILNALKAKCP